MYDDWQIFAVRGDEGLWSGGIRRGRGFGRPSDQECDKHGFATEAEAKAYGRRLLAERAKVWKRRRDADAERDARWQQRHEESAAPSAHEPRSDYFNADALLLGLDPRCEHYKRADILRAFRQKAQEHHPDVGGDPAEFRRIAGAKDRLLRQLPQAA